MRLQHPESTNPPIEVAPDQVARYETQGWHKVAATNSAKKKAAPKPADTPPPSEN